MSYPTEWERTRNYIDDLKCPKCKGHGEYDDAEPGDMSFNTYQCKECNATGFVEGAVQQLVYV